MNLTISTYLRNTRRLFPLSVETSELYKNIIKNLEKTIKTFDDDIDIIGIYTPEYKNTVVYLDKCYIVIDFSLLDLMVELSYIYANDDWDRYYYLYYTLAQEPELESGNIDKVFFYSNLADKFYDEEKERTVDNSTNMLYILDAFYFIAFHEFFHNLENKFSHSKEYYKTLIDYIENIDFAGNSSSKDIAREVVCDTEAIIQLLHTGMGLRDGFISKTEIFEICLDTLVNITIIQVLLKRLEDANDITKRIWATFGWIRIFLSENEVLNGINYEKVIEEEKKKIDTFMKNTIIISKEEKKQKVLIPDLSVSEQMELLDVFLNVKDGTIIRI